MTESGLAVSKKLQYGLGGLAGVLVAYGAASWWAGVGAEKAMQQQLAQIGKLPYFIVKQSSYQRGWFSAEQTVELELSDSLTWPYQAYLKFADKPYTPIRIKYRNRIQHGPLPLLGSFNLRPLKARVETELLLSAEAKKALKPFFGDQPPIRIENRIAFNNDGDMRIGIPAFDYEEAISGVKVKWNGLQSGLNYAGDYNRYDVDALLPGIHLDAAGKGTIDAGKLSVQTESQRGVAGLMLGKGQAQLASLAVETSKPSPFKGSLNALQYGYQTNASGDYLNSDVQLGFASLDLSGKRYGPADMAFAARHLHAPTVAKLEQVLRDIQKQGLSTSDDNGKAFAMFKQNGMPLLRNDPELELKHLTLRLTEGEVKLKGRLALKGFVDADVDQPLHLLEKISADADLKLPKKVVETYIRLLVRNILIERSGSQLSDEQVENIDSLAQQLVQGQIANLIEQKLIRAEGDVLATTALWRNGKLTVNNVAVPLPWQKAATPAVLAE